MSKSKKKSVTRPVHEVDSNKGHHRISLGSVVGEWEPWRGIAKLTVGSITYHACTSYYEGCLPVGQVFTIRVAS